MLHGHLSDSLDDYIPVTDIWVKGRQWKKFSIVIKQFQNPGKTYLITSSVLIYIPVRGTLYSINLYMVKLLITIRRFPPDIPGFYTI